MPLPGRVLRLDADGTLTPVVEDLFLPIGADVDADGNVFVTVNSIAFGPGGCPAWSSAATEQPPPNPSTTSSLSAGGPHARDGA